MAKFSKKVMGKEVGQASTYAKPHTMSGKNVSIKSAQKYQTDPNSMSAVESAPGGMPARRVSMGNPASEQMNKNGEIKIRGTGAATKGVMARGPMA
jgi:hypothetical protein